MNDKNKTIMVRVAATGMSGLILGIGSLVGEACAEETPWQFSVTPYISGSGIDASAGVGPVVTHVDLSAGDVMDMMQGGFLAMVTARRGKLLLAFDGSYFKLGDDPSGSVSGPGGSVTLNGTLDISNSQYIYQPMAGYTVLDEKVSMDLYGGLRYTRLKAALDLIVTSTIPSFPGGGTSFRAEKSWTDLVLGTHVSVPLAAHWTIDFLADVGSGEDSDLSWQLLVAPAWQINDRFSASLGYRLIHQDYADADFNWEVDYSGVVVGLGIHF